MPKILIIRFSSIGDIVLTTPVIRCLKQQVNDVQVHYLVKSRFREVIAHNPYLDKIHTVHSRVSEIIDELRNEKFDCVIDLHHNLRSAQVKVKLRVPSSSFNKLNVQKWLAVRLKWNRLPDKHIVDRYMETVQALKVTNDNRGLDYFIAPADEVNVITLPPAHQHSYIAFAIGAQHFTKRLPVEKIISICKKVKLPVVLLGGKEDMARGEEIRKGGGEKIFNACGKYSLGQSASLVKQAEYVIAHDTGLMHIAAAFKKRVYSVWGNTIPGFGMYPYMPGEGSKIIEVKGLKCRPCSKLGFGKCPRGHFRCMKDIDEGEFVQRQS